MTEPISIPPAIEEFLQRAKAADLTADYREYSKEWATIDYPGFVRYEARNGRGTRRFNIDYSHVKGYLNSNFEDHTFLGELDAILDHTTGLIEARIVPASSNFGPSLMQISRLPGVTRSASQRPTSEADTELDPSVDNSDDWSLRVDDSGVELEIAPIDSNWNLFTYNASRVAVGIRISGTGATTHEAALAALMRFAGAFLFELDVLYGVPAQFARKRQPINRSTRSRAIKPPNFPKNEYSRDALALYNYGRSASSLPLLEFLAYYQALEYFFPSFSHQETSAALRRLLLNPRFDPTDSSTINNLIRTAAPAGRGGTRERDQIRSALLACMDEEGLRDLIATIDPKDEHFTAKKQVIRGVTALRLTGDVSIREQVAERIYAIRCRVVHTKQDGNGPGDELLLPTSREALSLGPEIVLLRLITQEALVQQAKR